MRKRYFTLGILVSINFSYANIESETFSLEHQLQKAQQKTPNIITQDAFFSSQKSAVQYENIVEIHSFEELTYYLLESINQKQTEHIQQLLELYKSQQQAQLAMITFAQANIALNQGERYQAIKYYEKTLELAPEFIRAKLDLARLYFSDARLTEAKRLFAEIDLPENPTVMEKVQQYRDALKQREQWQGNISLSYGYVRNLNQSAQYQRSYLSDEFGEPVQITQSSPKAINTMGLKYAFVLNKYQHLSRNHGIQFRSSILGEVYRHQPRFQEKQLNTSLSYRYLTRQSDLSLGPFLAWVEEGGQRLQYDYGFRAEYAFDNLERSYHIFVAEYKQEDYHPAHLKPYSGKQWRFSATQIFAFKPQTTLFAGISYTLKHDTEFREDGFYRYGMFAGMEHTFQTGFSVELSANINATYYRAFNDTLATKRRDLEWTYNANIKAPHWAIGGFEPSIRYQYQYNLSNVNWLYSYKKSEVYLNWEWRF
ncbi:surface lipoprotein assembly modifier [Bisgaard Taxon 45]|uniref:Surface lipoprotein assembly modifier n=1 Tax=Bisgaard Taxon 45 TaxID=304289 RepID=A0ABT9KC49_9PAST|nr:surface lipoprotein assembly modifier [Bisgaard Taxon 45]